MPSVRQVETRIDLIPGVGQTVFPDAFQELLGKQFIRPSSSPWGAPILFVKKKDWFHRMCIDYQELKVDSEKSLPTS